MLNINLIKSFSVDDIIVINDLYELAKRAREIAKLIKNTYTFDANENKIKILDDGKNSEYLTHDRWIIEHEDLSISLPCDEETFYQCLRSDYLVSHGLCDVHESFVNDKIIDAFKSFVLRTQQLSVIRKVK